MKNASLCLLALAALSIPSLHAAPKKTKASASAHSAAKSGTKSRAVTRSTSSRSTVASKGRKTQSVSQRSRYRGQVNPTNDRYREIQQALKDKGYLQAEPTGTWDSGSQDAMRRFQADQHLDQTGKINSLSLIALGLGPTYTNNVEAALPVPQPK